MIEEDIKKLQDQVKGLYKRCDALSDGLYVRASAQSVRDLEANLRLEMTLRDGIQAELKALRDEVNAASIRIGSELGAHYDQIVSLVRRVIALEAPQRAAVAVEKSIWTCPSPKPPAPQPIPVTRDMLRPGLIVKWCGGPDADHYRIVVAQGTLHMTVAPDWTVACPVYDLKDDMYVTATDRGPFGNLGVLWHEVANANV